MKSEGFLDGKFSRDRWHLDFFGTLWGRWSAQGEAAKKLEWRVIGQKNLMFSRWFQIFLIFTPKIRQMIKFDYSAMFQIDWNHQPVMFCLCSLQKTYFLPKCLLAPWKKAFNRSDWQPLQYTQHLSVFSTTQGINFEIASPSDIALSHSK